MEIQKLYDMLEDAQGKKGYLFNRDKQRVFELLESLLVNRDRYGYMACPCRLATGKRDRDGDIICPCVYRKADIDEYGSCYCNLYVTEGWNKETIPHGFIPERRLPEKLDFRGEKT